MNYNDYVKHMYQKYRIAVAIAVLKEKPGDITLEQHIENLKEKLNHSLMDLDNSDLISLKDFNFDDDTMNITYESTATREEDTEIPIEKVRYGKELGHDDSIVTNIARRSENSNSFTDILETLTNIDSLNDSMEIEVETDFSQVTPPNQLLVDRVTKNINKATNIIEETSKTTTNVINTQNYAKNIEQEINNKDNNKNLRDAEQTKLIHLNNSQSQFLITNNSKIQEKSATVLRKLNKNEIGANNIIHEQKTDYKTNEVLKGEAKNKSDERTDENNDNLLDTQQTVIYTVPHMDFTEVSQSQSQIMAISNKYITGDKNKGKDREIFVHSPFNNINGSLDRINLFNNEDFVDPKRIIKFNNEDLEDTAQKNNIFDINSGQIEYIIDSSGQRYNVLQQYTTENVNEKCFINNTVPRMNTNVQDIHTMNAFGTEFVQCSENVPWDVLNKNGICIQNSAKSPRTNGSQCQNTNLQNGAFEKQFIHEHGAKLKENAGNRTDAGTGTNTATQSINTDTGTTIGKNTEIQPTNTEIGKSTGIQSQEIFEEELEYKDEAVPFKIIKELSKVKSYLRGKERRSPSTDGFSSDSGYRSDSQTSYVNVHINHWVHQSAFCLYNYIAESPIVSTDITGDISQVLGCLIDKLHLEEKYPNFLESLLDKVQMLLQELYQNSSDLNNLLEKDEIVQRILLLNKSVHVQKFTLEKIVAILNNIHEALSENIPNEITNTALNENICYIFYTMEILLTKYIKNKNVTTELSMDSQEKVLKKSSVADIWRKKWNPNFKEAVQRTSQESCVLKKCSEILNNIVVDCVESYSLIAFSALQCFNLLQK